MKKTVAVLFIIWASLLFPMIAGAEEKNADTGVRRARYVFLHEEDDMRYYLDRESMRKTPHPYLKEDLLDVWVKLVSQEKNSYTYPQPYLLKNYYLRLTKPQIQLRVILRADTLSKSDEATKIPYREKNWQDVYPDSLEEILYRSILKYWQRK